MQVAINPVAILFQFLYAPLTDEKRLLQSHTVHTVWQQLNVTQGLLRRVKGCGGQTIFRELARSFLARLARGM
jgi:hypothetical protein